VSAGNYNKSQKDCIVNLSYFTVNNFCMVLVLKKGASKKEMESIEKKLKSKSGIDVIKYCGLVKLKDDALAIQKNLRNEWK
jgi:hypothetical protein